MAAHILRLRIALLWGALRGDPGHVTRVVLGVIILVAGTIAACWALLTLREASIDVAATVTVLGGGAVMLGFAFGPLVAPIGDPLDPRRFAALGLAPAPLAAVLAVVGVISMPMLALIALVVAVAQVWTAHGAPLGVTILGAALAVLICTMLARVAEAVAAMFLRERRSRELSGLFVMLLLVVLVPTGVFLASLQWHGAVPPQLREAVGALASTPIGAAWALPFAVSLGAPQTAVITLVGCATLAVLIVVWMWAVRRMLTTTERPHAGRERAGLGWFGVAPGTPGGAIAARSLLYWFSDRRYIVNILVIPLAALLTMVPLLVAGVPFALVVLVPVPFIALFLGWLPHNDLAYDSTGIWMHLASGVRGVSDRVGRLVPVLLLGIPVLAVAIPVVVSLHGRWAILPALTGVCAALFLGGLGLSSVSSAAAPYAASIPGESPWRQPQRTESSGVFAQSIVMLGAVATAVPAGWWAWRSLDGDLGAAETALWWGVGAGAVVLLIGISIGSVVFERRGGRLLEFAESV